jgi:hypothetical protein
MVQYISYTCHKKILHPGKKMCNTVTFAIALGYNWVNVVIKVLSTNFLVFYWKYPIERHANFVMYTVLSLQNNKILNHPEIVYSRCL